jgi:DNA-binding transcriptional MerR regulator
MRPVRRDKEISPVKLYYRIGEVAGLVGVEPHVLRYWESEFPTVRPQKSRSGQRVYSRRDVETLMRVKDLLYAQRFTIAGARQRLRSSLEPDAAISIKLDERTLAEASHDVRSDAVSEPSQPEQPEPGPSATAHPSAEHMRAALLSVRERIVGLLEKLDASRADGEQVVK